MLTRLRNLKGVVAVSLLLILGGCAGTSSVYRSGKSPGGTYVVKKGDTLYSIAFRYGLDYKSLARINGIGPPYTIYARQTIKLRGSARMPAKDSGPTVSKTTTRPKPKPSVPNNPVSSWRWPVSGEVIAPFSLTNPVNKGIDIAGKKGDPVKAAADGVVVYAGGNLRGYGKLVIIKHNDNFLSAYGNNEALLIKEGDSVKKGKTIARVGKSAANKEMLHFEIRRDGKPEDPIKYLPRR